MNPKLNRQRGKRAEKAIATILHGTRVGILGGEDVSHRQFSVEVKERKRFIGSKFMTQAESNTPPGKIPLVCIHVLNQRHEKDLVMVRLEDFQELFIQ